MLRTISLFLLLLGTWLLMSGIYTPLMISFGVISCALVTFIARRMDVIDEEGHPVQLGPRIIRYWLWLLLEIFKANIDVAKCVFSPGKYLNPSFFRTRFSQKSDLAKVIYANSITLTPGTTTIEIDDDSFLVHALTKEGADGVKSGDMDQRVTKMMGEA